MPKTKTKKRRMTNDEQRALASIMDDTVIYMDELEAIESYLNGPRRCMDYDSLPYGIRYFIDEIATLIRHAKRSRCIR